MKTLIALALGLMSVTASAAGPEMLRFFEALEGDWQGQGVYARTADGREFRRDYALEIDVEYAGARSWRVENIVDDVNGHHLLVGYFSVRGDSLYLSSGSPYTPVAVVESTDQRLVYRFQQVEGPTGLVHEYSFTLNLGQDSRLTGENTVTSGGTHISSDQFQVEKSRAHLLVQ